MGSEGVDRAWSMSMFARLPERAATVLLDSAIEKEYEAGDEIYREPVPGSRSAILALVVSGLLRLYVTSAEGREVTLRYDREGDVLGLSSVVAGGAPATLEAVSDSHIVLFQVDVMRYLVKKNPVVASLVAENLAQSVFKIQEMLVDNVFGSVRNRVASHLIDLAVTDDSGKLVAHISHQDVADAIGSVREVVSRVLGALRNEGLISRDRDGITLVDIPALYAIANRPLPVTPNVGR